MARTKAEQTEQTTAHLIDVGRALFARHGYAQTSTEEIVNQAGLTRGALYHHFGNKEGLFQAVLARVQQEVAQHVEMRAAESTDRWLQLVEGCRAFFEASTDAQVRQIMLIDAPAVVGWEGWRKQDQEHSMPMLRASIDELIESGEMIALPSEALTHLLSGAMNEAALWVAQAEDSTQALRDANICLERLLNALHQDQATEQGQLNVSAAPTDSRGGSHGRVR